jgi:hypothetical protein
MQLFRVCVCVSVYAHTLWRMHVCATDWLCARVCDVHWWCHVLCLHSDAAFGVRGIIPPDDVTFASGQLEVHNATRVCQAGGVDEVTLSQCYVGVYVY